MKKIIFQSFLAFSLMQTVGVNAQLTVKGASSFVYVGDEVLFVNQDVNLEDGKIYLRRKGQLLQGADASGSKVSANKGNSSGVLSTYILSKPTNEFNYTHYGLPVTTTTTAPGTSIGSNVFQVSPSSIGGVSGVTSMVGVDFNGVPYAANDGLTSTNGVIHLTPNFVSYFSSNSNGYDSWKYPLKNSADNFIPKGYGLYMKGTKGTDSYEPVGEGSVNKVANGAQRFEFRGIPNDGNIDISVAADRLYNLGNPYPSSFNLNKFIYDNRNIIEGVYFYIELNKATHQLASYNYGYAKYTPVFNDLSVETPEGTTGILSVPENFYRVDDNGNIISTTPASDPNYPNLVINTNAQPGFVGIGYGFWVQTKAAGSLLFRNNQRMYTDDVQKDGFDIFARSAAKENIDYGYYEDILNLNGVDYTKISKEPAPMISLAVTDGSEVKSLAVIYNDFDVAEESLHLTRTKAGDLKGKFNIYIDQPTGKYSLITDKFVSNARIPITIESKSDQNIDISLDNLQNFKVSNEVYIYDDYTGVYKDVLKNKVNLNVTDGVTKGRYYITFAKDNANLVDETVVNNAFIVLQNNKDKALTITNPEALNVVSTEIFDIQGRLVLSKRNLGTEPEYRFSTSSFADGIYVVKIATKNGKSVSKKVIVKN